MLTRLLFVLTGTVGTLALISPPAPPLPTAAPLPNIIFILADDLGYADLSCYGSPSVHTPHLDSLAAAGMQFTRFYAGLAVCSPSRACFLTGRFPLRFDIRRHFNDRDEHLPASAHTLADYLRAAGYATQHIGKWHLGGLREEDVAARTAGKPTLPGPLQHGFDYSLSSVEGAPIRPQLIRERKLYREGGHRLIRNDRRAAVNPKP
jgi:arylsulfatase A